MIERRYFYKKDLANYGTGPEVSTSREHANLIGSQTNFNLHAPVLDIDFPAKLVPSSTPGHYHLYLEKEITWEQYQKVLDAMADAGLIEPGYARAAKAQGGTFVRPPWIKKGDDRTLAQRECEAQIIRSAVLDE